MRPCIHGTGPGAVGVGGGVEGAMGAAVCCPNTLLAVTEAAIIAFTKSRRRMGRFLSLCMVLQELESVYAE